MQSRKGFIVLTREVGTAKTTLADRFKAGHTTALIVDEAHNLDWDVLEEIRLLGNLENRRGKLWQIVLAGQPELDRKLEAPEFRQLKSGSPCAAACAVSLPKKPRFM